MGIWAKIRTKATSVVLRALNLLDPQGWPGVNTSDAGEEVTTERLLGLSTAWSCVNLHAGTIGSLPLMVYQALPDGSRRVATDHWLHRLIHDSPNADQTALDFWEFMQACLELRGNAIAHAPRASKGRVIALNPKPVDLCQVRRSPEDGRLKYRWPGPRGEQTEFDQAEVFHVRGFGGGPLGGLSTLAFGRQTFGLALAVEKAAAATYRNGMRAPGALKFAEWLKPNQRDETRQYLEREHAGAWQAGKPLILEGGVSWEQMAFSAQDSQMLQNRAFSVEDICRFFSVPPVLVGHTEKVSAWGTGIQEITLGFVKFALRRRCKRIEQAIAKQLLPAEDRAAGYYVEFSMEGLLRGAPKERSEFYQRMTQSGIMAINECRRLENLTPVPGGDTPRLQMQYVALLPSNGIAPDDNNPTPPQE